MLEFSILAVTLRMSTSENLPANYSPYSAVKYVVVVILGEKGEIISRLCDNIENKKSPEMMIL